MLKKALITALLAFAPLYAEEEPPFDIAQIQIEEAPAGIDFSAELRRISMTLGGIIVLGALTLLALRRFTSRRQMRSNNASKIQVLEQRALAPKTAAYLIEVDGKKIFFVETAHAATALSLAEGKVVREFSELLGDPSSPQ